MKCVLEMKGITKVFGSVVANDKVDFCCHSGEVVCLLGENGAGKTTLMNVLYGRYRPDGGQIEFEGVPVSFTSPRDAIARGIQMVHQHFMLVNPLSVAENVVMGKEPKRRGLYDKARAEEIVRALSKEYGLVVPPEKKIYDLSVGEMQRVEIIKALYQGAQVLILDEPTASLTPQEVVDLFRVVKTLKESGKTVILITHKLKETMAVSDRVCIMRQGCMVAQRKTEETSIDELSELMVGQRVVHGKRKKLQPGAPVLSMRGVGLVNSYGKRVLDDVTLEVRQKEILGIAGVDGNGQAELQTVLSGLTPGWEGEIDLCGESAKGLTPKALIEKGVSCLFADRHRYGIAAGASALKNFLLGYHHDGAYIKNGWLIDWARVKEGAKALMEEYDVRPRDIALDLGDFSGGNQQKFVAGHTMHGPRLLVAALPTRGVDIKAANFIHDRMAALKEAGCGILMISSDLDEVLAISDRVAVLYDGKIVDCRPTEEYTGTILGNLMGGGKADESRQTQEAAALF